MTKPQAGQSRFLMWGAAAFALYACVAQWIGWSTQAMPVVLPAALTAAVAVLLAVLGRTWRLPKLLFIASSYGAVVTLAWAMGRPGFEYPGVSVWYGLSILSTMFLFAVFWLWEPADGQKDGWIPSAHWVLAPVFLLVLGGGLAYLSGERGAAGPMLSWFAEWGLSPAVADAITLAFRKGVHVLFYGTLAGLAYLWASQLGLARKQVLLFAWAWGITHSVFDEAHQLLTPSRQGSVWDLLINMVGMALALAWLSRKRN